MQNLLLIKIMRFFLEHPYREIYLRELARELKLSPYAVKKYVDLLIKENLINETKKGNLRYLVANTNNLFFKYLKISLNIKLILNSGLIEFLKENIVNISSIILFGSLAKGEDTEKSDIDLIVIGEKKEKKYLDLEEFERKLKREIKPHIFSWSEWKKKAKEDKPFYYEVIIYGIPLYGELPVVE